MTLPAERQPDGDLEPYVFEGQLVDEDEPGPEPSRTIAPAPSRAVQVVTALGSSSARAEAARIGRKAARHAWTAGAGCCNACRRAWFGARFGLYREQLRLHRLAGDHEQLQVWAKLYEDARKARVERLLKLPGEIGAVLLAAGASVVALLVLLLLGGIGSAVRPGGLDWTGWWLGVGDVLSFLGDVLSWLWAAAWVLVWPLLAVLAWREGKRATDPPYWLLTEQERAEADVVIDERAISQALAHLGVSALSTFVKQGGHLTFTVMPRRDGNGTYAQVRLCPGVVVDDVNRQRKRLAGNLHRAALEVWATTDERYDDEGLMDLWVADKGVLRGGAGSWPLLEDGTVDVFDGVPLGKAQRGHVVNAPIFASNYLIGGIPGQGKSATMRTLLLGCALDPTVELMVYAFGENTDFDPFAPRLSRFRVGVDDDVFAEALQTLRDLLAEMERRGKVLKTVRSPKVTRKLADRSGLGLHIIVCSMDEVHELFMHPEYGKEASDLAIRLIRRGRKYGIVLVCATQAPTKDSIPRDVTRNVSCGIAHAVTDHVANDGLLGTGKYKQGVRATELRRGVDVGTAMTVGLTTNTFELVKIFYIPFDEETDAVTPIVQRAMAAITELRRLGTQLMRPVPELVERDHLADVAEALRGERHVRTPVLLGRLIELDAAIYEPWGARDLAAALEEYGVLVGKSHGQSVVRLRDVQEALSERGSESG